MLYVFLATCAAWAAWVCYAAATLGCLYALYAARCVRGFVRSAPPAEPGACPPVTILKPLHGAEPDLYAHLRRFCAQDYPGEVQIVFGVDDPADPALGVARKLAADFPGRDITLVVNARRHGANHKVSNLINMADEARHEILVVSDSDIIVDSTYLRGVAATLQQPGVGVVTCLYHGIAAGGFWARLAAAAIDYHFLPDVLIGLELGLAAPCFGSTIALRKSTLAAIGGFRALVDELADDYVLGALVRRAGLRVAIPNRLVAHVCAEDSARDLFRHEIRWARTIRSVDPIGYAGSAITHAVPLALLGLIFGGLTPAGFIVVAAIGCRFALQAAVDRAFGRSGDFFWSGPLRDIVSFAVFVASFCGRGVEWRGHRYGLRTGNRLAYFGKVET